MPCIRKIALALLFLALCRSSEAQLIVDTIQTPQQLVQNVLLANSIIAYNVKYTGARRAMGYFDGSYSNIGLKNGVLMTTGSVYVAVGPNNPGNRGIANHLPGDSALTAISGDPTYDACILEFDFVPYADTVSFDFAFGSEEYPEFTCCKVNDVFAFFISGPGITGAKNIALVPSTTTPISINTINGNCTSLSNCGGGCCNSNSKYYFDNTGGGSIMYTGFTTVMKAESPVQCGEPYHIRIAIADGGDSIYDSGVFLGGGSFRGGTNALNISAVPIDSVCPNDNVTLYFPDNTPGHRFTWTFDGGIVQSGSGNGPYVVQWQTSGPKQVHISVSGSCTYDIDSLTVNVGACDVKVPNIFTPGTGDINSKFYIYNLDKYPYSNLMVINRWGTRVYYSTYYQNNWDGDKVPDGTYYYILTLPNSIIKEGFVTIVRK
ncbi:MAG TPA: choice-of-anchor L domain-containing protein [Bacteroidia bacterium]|jgi:gliding motility-associated-like protein|nr:choice-of-anchor L domain-containing protein [Bacteroidia bacterium]